MSEQTLTPRRRRIATASRLMAGLTLALAIALPALVVGYWVVTSPAGLAQQAKLPAASVLVLDLPVRLIAAGISAIPVLALSWGMLRLRRCFQGFARGELFAARTIAGFRDFALGLVATALLTVPANMLLSLLVSGGRQLSIQISSDTLLMLCVAGAMAVVGWVLGEAAEIAEENAGFV